MPLTGLAVVLFGLSAVLADQLGSTSRDAGSLADTAARTGAALVSTSLSGLDPAEARSRASRLDTGPACRAARSAVSPAAHVTTCSIVGSDFVVVLLTTGAPTSTASARVSLTEGPRT